MADLEPARDSEAVKRRPAVIVSNDRANATTSRLGRGVVTVVPVTSNTSRVFPFQTLLPAEDTGLRALPLLVHPVHNNRRGEGGARSSR